MAESIYAAKNDYTFLANKKQKLGSVFGFLLANVLCNRLYAEMFFFVQRQVVKNKVAARNK